MNNYITYRDTDNEDNLQYYVLQKDYPHIVAMISDIPIINFVQPVPVSGYNLWLIFSGTLRGNFLPGYNSIFEEVKVVVTDMALWFYENRVLSNEKKYKKWKVNVSSPVQ